MMTSEEDEDPDSPEAITRWAEGTGEEIAAFQGLLEAAGDRAGLNPDLVDAIKEMKAGLTAMIEGELPSDSWRLELTLSQGMDDGSSHGTRTYALSVNDAGLRAECYGTEWQQGEGSDSWTGSTFSYRPPGLKEESGYFYEFTNEFEDAVGDTDYVLSVEFNGESICRLPTDSTSDSEVELQVKQLIRQLISELQDMQDTLSGDDSCLVNVWDEICAQEQIQRSVCWHVYEETMNVLIDGMVDEMSHEDLVKLWLITDQGGDWEIDRESEDEQPTPYVGDVSVYLYARLINVADYYLNHRIIPYRDRPYRD